MIPELGHLALVLALCLSGLLAVFGLVGASLGRGRLLKATPSLVAGQFVFCALAFAALTHAFLTDDFSVAVGIQPLTAIFAKAGPGAVVPFVLVGCFHLPFDEGKHSIHQRIESS